ncbi:hypothetical protein ACEN2J_17660 [Pseudorhodobacter sp. W20_MBD10_FR17]|uniref:hypothetical protein n=1 Tax=Pseudorhodobacter sp. W20_MBD10_FR17 TaxID=3240266 RepID=UPI003F9C74D0
MRPADQGSPLIKRAHWGKSLVVELGHGHLLQSPSRRNQLGPTIWLSGTKKLSQFGYFKTSREIIELAVMMHVRIPLIPTFLTCSLVPDQFNLLKSSVSAQKDK